MSQKKTYKKSYQAEAAATESANVSVTGTSSLSGTAIHKDSDEQAFGPKNYLLMAVGVVLLVVGYFLMAGGDSADPAVFNPEEKYNFTRTTLSVILVLAGLLIQVPAIMLKK